MARLATAPPATAYALAGIKLLLHLATNRQYGFHRDELYFIACGSRLEWGYVDQGPWVPAMAALARALGDSLSALRFLPALAGALTVFATCWLASLLGGGRFAQCVTGLAVLIAPAYLRMHTMLHIPTFESMFWSLASVLLALALVRDDTRFFAPLGAIAGLGLLNKPTIVLFGVGLVIGLALSRESRRWLLHPHLWAGGAVALLIAAPFLAWQMRNGWPSADFVAELNADTLDHIPSWAFILGQLVYLHPIAAPLWLGGLAFLLFAPAVKRVRPLAWTWVVPFAIFLATGAKLYYLAAAYPPLLAAGGVWLERALRGVAARRTAVALLVLGGVVLAPAGLPIVPLDRYPDFIRSLTGGRSRAEELHEVINDYYDMTGWLELAAAVGDVERDLDRRGVNAGIFTKSYGEASALRVLAPELPEARSGNLSFHLWGPGTVDPQVEILVGFEPDEARTLCAELELAARFQHPHDEAPEDDVPILVCTPRQPLREVWPSLRLGF